MTFQGLLSGGLGESDQELAIRMLTRDPELLHLALGLLIGYEP